MANRKVKTWLTQAARSAVLHDKELREYYQRKIAQGKEDRVVINNVRNKLIHRVFAVVQRKEKYQADYRTNQQKNVLIKEMIKIN